MALTEELVPQQAPSLPGCSGAALVPELQVDIGTDPQGTAGCGMFPAGACSVVPAHAVVFPGRSLLAAGAARP